VVLQKSIEKPSWILVYIQTVETVNCAEKGSIKPELQKLVLSKNFQRPLRFVPSNNELPRELAEHI